MAVDMGEAVVADGGASTVEVDTLVALVAGTQVVIEVDTPVGIALLEFIVLLVVMQHLVDTLLAIMLLPHLADTMGGIMLLLHLEDTMAVIEGDTMVEGFRLIGDYGDGDFGDGLFWDGPMQIGPTCPMEDIRI